MGVEGLKGRRGEGRGRNEGREGGERGWEKNCWAGWVHLTPWNACACGAAGKQGWGWWQKGRRQGGNGIPTVDSVLGIAPHRLCNHRMPKTLYRYRGPCKTCLCTPLPSTPLPLLAHSLTLPHPAPLPPLVPRSPWRSCWTTWRRCSWRRKGRRATRTWTRIWTTGRGHTLPSWLQPNTQTPPTQVQHSAACCQPHNRCRLGLHEGVVARPHPRAAAFHDGVGSCIRQCDAAAALVAVALCEQHCSSGKGQGGGEGCVEPDASALYLCACPCSIRLLALASVWVVFASDGLWW